MHITIYVKLRLIPHYEAMFYITPKEKMIVALNKKKEAVSISVRSYIKWFHSFHSLHHTSAFPIIACEILFPYGTHTKQAIFSEHCSK